MPIRSRMSSIMEQIKPENPELFALEFAKIMTMRSWISYFWVKSDSNIWSYMPLNKEKLFHLTLFTL